MIAGQRLDAAHARRRPRFRRSPRSGRYRRCAAHACRRTVRPTSRARWRRARARSCPSTPRAPRRHISRRTARARRRRGRHRRAISRVVTSSFSSTTSLAMSSTRAQFVRRDRLRMHEVEAQPIRRHQRAALRDVIAEHLPQRLVQQMRRRVIGADRCAPCVIDLERQRHARLQRALLDRAEMHEEIAGLLLRIGDAERDALAGHHAGVADLAAGLRIKRRLVQHDRAALAGLEAVDFLAVLAPARDTTPSAVSVS